MAATLCEKILCKNGGSRFKSFRKIVRIKIEKKTCIFEGIVVIYISRAGEACAANVRVWRSLVSRLNGVQEAAGSNPVTRTMWTRVGVLNSFLRLSNAPTLVLLEKALLFQAFSFLMHSPVINIAKTKGAGFVVEKRKIPSFEPLVQISLSALFFAHGAIRTHPVSYS